MALIKKQVFLRSKDENLQQFLAKASSKDSGYGAGNKGMGSKPDTANLEQRWGQPSSKDKPNTKARSKGLMRGVSEKEGDAAKKNPHPSTVSPPDPSGRDYPGEVHDRDDLPDQGWDNSNSAQKEYVEKSKYMSLDEQANLSDEEIADAEARVKKPGKGQKAKWVPEDYDADEDGPFKVDAHWSAKEFIIEGVRDAYLEKARKYPPGESPRERWERQQLDDEMKDEARWDEQAERDQAGDEKEMDEWADYEEDMRNQGPPDIDEDQDESDAPRGFRKAIRDAWFEKARSAANRAKVTERRNKAKGEKSDKKRLAQHEAANQARSKNLYGFRQSYASTIADGPKQERRKRQDRKTIKWGKNSMSRDDELQNPLSTGEKWRKDYDQRARAKKQADKDMAESQARVEAATPKPSEAEEYFRARI